MKKFKVGFDIKTTIGERFRMIFDPKTSIKAFLYSLGFLIIFDIATALIPNPIFVRMISSNILDYLFLFSTALLSGMYVALPQMCRVDNKAAGGGILGILAFSCPICNKILLLLFGSTVLLTYIEPLRPFIGIISISILLFAINQKIRK